MQLAEILFVALLVLGSVANAGGDPTVISLQPGALSFHPVKIDHLIVAWENNMPFSNGSYSGANSDPLCHALFQNGINPNNYWNGYSNGQVLKRVWEMGTAVPDDFPSTGNSVGLVFESSWKVDGHPLSITLWCHSPTDHVRVSDINKAFGSFAEVRQ